MVKRSIFTFLLGALQLVSLFAFESGDLDCNVPPPANFHITSRGPNFIDLAWEPIVVGATHTLIVLTNTGSGGNETWVLVDTFHNIPGSSFTIHNIGFTTHCKVKITTNCFSFIPGTETDSLEDKPILDLSIPGRTPINPIVVNCEGIEFNNPMNEWVGFRVTFQYNNKTTVGLFEFEYEPIKFLKTGFTYIKRVPGTFLVAGNESQDYPTVNNPDVISQNPFYMYNLANTGLPFNFGRVGITKHFGSHSTVDLCVYDSEEPWDYEHYTFEALVANQVVGFVEQSSERSLSNSGNLKITNPIRDIVSVSLPESIEKSEPTLLYIINMEGQIISKQIVNFSMEQFSLPFEHYLPGFYIFRLESAHKIFTAKVVKI